MEKQALRLGVDARSLLCQRPRGEGKTLLRLYDELCALRPNWSITFFGDASAGAYRGRLPDGVTVAQTSLMGDRWNAWEDVWLPLAAWRRNCDVLHCASSGAPWRAGLPVVLTVHDLIPLVFDDGHDPFERLRFRKRLQAGLSQAQQVITVSRSTRDDLQRTFPAFSGAVEVVPWGSAGYRAHDASSLRQERRTVLVFGGVARRKNTAYAVARFLAAARRAPMLHLHLVGVTSAEQQTQLQAMLSEAGMLSRATIDGFVSEEQLRTLLTESTMLLYPSLYEGFGVPLVEAIEAGVPVIASDRASVPEVLGDAPGAFDLDAPAAIEDCIVELAVDADARRAFADAQARVLRRLSWSVTAKRTAEIIERAAARPRRAAISSPSGEPS